MIYSFKLFLKFLQAILLNYGNDLKLTRKHKGNIIALETRYISMHDHDSHTSHLLTHVANNFLSTLLHHQHILQNDILDKITEVDLIQSETNLIRADIDATTKQTSGRGRVSRRTNISIDNDRV